MPGRPGRWPGRRRGQPGSSRPLVLAGHGVLRVQRKAAAHPPALRCRPGRELAAERGRPLPHPDQSVPGSLAARWKARRPSARSSRRRGAPARRPPPSPEPSARAARAVPHSRAPPGLSGRARLRRSARCGRGPRAYAAGPQDHPPSHGRPAPGSPSPTGAVAPPPPRRRCGAARPYGVVPACCAGLHPRPTAGPPRRPRDRGAAHGGRW